MISIGYTSQRLSFLMSLKVRKLWPYVKGVQCCQLYFGCKLRCCCSLIKKWTIHVCIMFQNQKSTNILPWKYNRQRRQLLFLVCLQVSEKVGLWKKTVDSRFGRSSSCFFILIVLFHSKGIIWYLATTFLYIIIILCYVINSTVWCQILAGRWANPKKWNLLKDFFVSANIIQQVVDFWFWKRI
jgi:hypothetical protein